jgi:beta-lactamase class A
MIFSRCRVSFLLIAALVCASATLLESQQQALKEDAQLDQELQSIAAAHRGMVALYAHNLKTGETAAIKPDEPVQTASTIKMGILLDAAEQIRAGKASFDEKLLLTKENQVQGSGVLGQLAAPLTLVTPNA